ncbi:beta-galactosidase [Pelagovum pacificum]|uniref:Beta-galactosidase n=1 Tax=Pelagovum pacificum TaxID=2588711 RepID=A0A5C5GB55_9RHOB|nr:beta-galactosidase [Pelagovum pacificum]QQA41417.1 beta-galactosidase [Pelagovum pacificum]TNY31780.1 beta-galactosidase [Pelagovum pacificum]
MKFNRNDRPISVWRPIDTDTFLVGAPHYPEHVDDSFLERDAERMKAAGFNIVRMAEFAWHIMEPRENTYDFSLFDRAIEVLGKHGIKTILCTPTATPPRWLTQHYPEVLRTDVRGRPASHGSRQHADTSSPVYRTHSQRITRVMSEHYRDNPHVVGWQTDNELNTSTSLSYSEVTRREFQKFLEDRYDNDIAKLNFAWGGDFWATAYDNFDQVVLPLDNAPVSCSPGHVLDYHRFLAFATARFQSDQIEILREVNPEWFIFHNLGRMTDIDFRGPFSRELDFNAYDFYPLLHDEMQRLGGPGLVHSQHLDVARSHSGNFIVPEQQSGFGSQPPFSTLTPEPGEMRRMAYSSVSRGADGVMFFRWRPAHFGAEIYWMGVIDHDDIPRRRYDEAKQFAGEVTAMKDKLLGTHVRMDVGIAGADFDNEEAHKTYAMGLPSPHDDALILHSHCYRRGIAAGFIHPEDDLSPLKVLYVPHWLIWREEWTAKLEAWVRAGGTLILSARTGSRDINNHVIHDPAPGKPLTALAGVTVEEFGRLTPPDADGLFALGGMYDTNGKRVVKQTESSRRKYRFRLGNQEFTAAHMYEHLSLSDGAEPAGEWSNRWLEGQPVISRRAVGEGQVIYVGTYLTEDMMPAFEDQFIAPAGVTPMLEDLPEGMEVSMRQSDDRRLLFVLNTTSEPLDVPAGLEGSALIDDRKGNALQGYGVLVLEL